MHMSIRVNIRLVTSDFIPAMFSNLPHQCISHLLIFILMKILWLSIDLRKEVFNVQIRMQSKIKSQNSVLCSDNNIVIEIRTIYILFFRFGFFCLVSWFWIFYLILDFFWFSWIFNFFLVKDGLHKIYLFYIIISKTKNPYTFLPAEKLSLLLCLFKQQSSAYCLCHPAPISSPVMSGALTYLPGRVLRVTATNYFWFLLQAVEWVCGASIPHQLQGKNKTSLTIFEGWRGYDNEFFSLCLYSALLQSCLVCPAASP